MSDTEFFFHTDHVKINAESDREVKEAAAVRCTILLAIIIFFSKAKKISPKTLFYSKVSAGPQGEYLASGAPAQPLFDRLNHIGTVRYRSS